MIDYDFLSYKKEKRLKELMKTINAICDEYPEATTIDALYDVKIDGTFCDAIGTYEIWLDDGWRIFFKQEMYDTNTEKENIINEEEN